MEKIYETYIRTLPPYVPLLTSKLFKMFKIRDVNVRSDGKFDELTVTVETELEYPQFLITITRVVKSVMGRNYEIVVRCLRC